MNIDSARKQVRQALDELAGDDDQAHNTAVFKAFMSRATDGPLPPGPMTPFRSLVEETMADVQTSQRIRPIDLHPYVLNCSPRRPTMAKKRNDALIEKLALHLATGRKPEAFAKDHGISERTAYLWARLPECRENQTPAPAEDRRACPRQALSPGRRRDRGRREEPGRRTTVRQRAAEFLLTSLRDVCRQWVELEGELERLKRLVEEVKPRRRVG